MTSATNGQVKREREENSIKGVWKIHFLFFLLALGVMEPDAAESIIGVARNQDWQVERFCFGLIIFLIIRFF